MTWETVIGLEVHVQLATQSKLFSGSSTAFGAEPNTQASAIDLGLPGVLPVMNAGVVEMAILLGLAISGEIAPRSIFARKNYFYPDLPKGYQISQYEFPVISKGHLDIRLAEGGSKRIHMTRAHLEEDAGKSLHEDFHGQSGIDLNRAGTPLLEIVSEPDMRSASEAVAWLKELHSLVCYLGICDGNMQEGSFRCDANVSLHKKGEPYGTRTELKNINSFRFVEKAIEHEVARQAALLAGGGRILQETRLYDPDRDETRPMRSKEEANDYRYFPDPDLLPLEITESDIAKAREKLPELPWEKRARFVKAYGLSQYDADVLTVNREQANYFEAVAEACSQPKLAANWIMGELSALLNKSGLDITASPVTPDSLAQLICRITDQTLSNRTAKTVFEALWESQGSVDEIIDREGLRQVTETGIIEKLVDEVLADNPDQVAAFRGGREKLFGFFVGQAMKKSGGKLNPQQLNAVLQEKLQDKK